MSENHEETELYPSETCNNQEVRLQHPLIEIEVEEVREADPSSPSNSEHDPSEAEVENDSYESMFFNRDIVPHFWLRLRDKYGSRYPIFFRITEILCLVVWFITLSGTCFYFVLAIEGNNVIHNAIVWVILIVISLSLPLFIINNRIHNAYNYNLFTCFIPCICISSRFLIFLCKSMVYSIVKSVYNLYLCIKEGIGLCLFIFCNKGGGEGQ